MRERTANVLTIIARTCSPFLLHMFYPVPLQANLILLHNDMLITAPFKQMGSLCKFRLVTKTDTQVYSSHCLFNRFNYPFQQVIHMLHSCNNCATPRQFTVSGTQPYYCPYVYNMQCLLCYSEHALGRQCFVELGMLTSLSKLVSTLYTHTIQWNL